VTGNAATRPDELAAFLDMGLDLTTDTVTDAERAEVLAWYREKHGHDELELAPFAGFLLERDPTTFKRLRRHVLALGRELDGPPLPIAVAVFLFVHTYVVLGMGKGALYEIVAVRALGASRAEVDEVLALAALNGGPRGVNALAEVADGYLRDWEEEDDGPGLHWPDGWAADVGALRHRPRLGRAGGGRARADPRVVRANGGRGAEPRRAARTDRARRAEDAACALRDGDPRSRAGAARAAPDRAPECDPALADTAPAVAADGPLARRPPERGDLDAALAGGLRRRRGDGDGGRRRRRPARELGRPGLMFTGANHVCVVTRDLDRAIRAWADRYGVGPWQIWRKDGSNMTAAVHGRPVAFAMRVALCSLSPTFRLELIEPLDERSPYASSLERHGGRDHVHHLRLEVDDYRAAREHLTALGVAIPLDASFDGAPGVGSQVTATYFDTEAELGFMLELARVPDGFAMPAPDAVHPVGKEVERK
jgi:hypothetical protein